jgi:phosphatidylglycerol---prolipoprotein diacylglyceryl transferase
MQQVLFHVGPFPIFGYGMMLFLAFMACTWLASRLCLREGIAPQRAQDLAIWVFVFGILGARITYMILDYHGEDLLELVGKFFKIWEGGLVFYGSLIGGAIGYGLAYLRVLRRYHISSWKMADVIAPCAALGLAIGRVGCLLNGCCYGNVACPDCMAVHFPLSAPPRYQMVESGYQTSAGFTLKDNIGGAPTVDKVEPGSAAERAGLKAGDRIVHVDGQDVASDSTLSSYLGKQWPRGKNDLELAVLRGEPGRPGVTHLVSLPAFSPRTIGLHPTQVYETISMVLLLVVMLVYWPFRRRDGMLMVMFMLGYAVHRYLDELLRDDPRGGLFAGMTISEIGSILLFILGMALLAWIWHRPPQYRLVGGESESTSANGTAHPSAVPAES